MSTCYKIHLPQASGKSQHHPPLASSYSPFFPCLSSGPTSLLPAPGPRDAKEFQGITLSPAMSQNHPSAAFSLARAKSHQCDPVSIREASQRVSPACSASLQHLILHAKNMKIFFSPSPHFIPVHFSLLPFLIPEHMGVLQALLVEIPWSYSCHVPGQFSRDGDPPISHLTPFPRSYLMALQEEGLFDLYLFIDGKEESGNCNERDSQQDGKEGRLKMKSSSNWPAVNYSHV